LPGSEVQETNFRSIFGLIETEFSGSGVRKSFRGKIQLKNSEPTQDEGQCKRRSDWLRAGRIGVRISVEAIDFLISKTVQTGSGPPPSRLCNGFRGSYPEVKRPGSKVDHSPPSSAVVTNEWRYTFTPPISPHGVGRENFSTYTVEQSPSFISAGLTVCCEMFDFTFIDVFNSS